MTLERLGVGRLTTIPVFYYKSTEEAPNIPTLKMVSVDWEGNFKLDGDWHHTSQLTDIKFIDGSKAKHLSTWDYLHPDGECCDAYICCGM